MLIAGDDLEIVEVKSRSEFLVERRTSRDFIANIIITSTTEYIYIHV